jgi:leader peptidase (prepilin peptidase) / N-methyltransferase
MGENACLRWRPVGHRRRRRANGRLDSNFGTGVRGDLPPYNQPIGANTRLCADAMDPYLALAMFVLGLIFGSFLNVCIYRLPRDLSVVLPGSTCPSCERPIRFYDNIPVLSWLLLLGRCRNCKARISPRYLVIELLTGGMFLACYSYFGFTLATLKFCTFGFLVLGLIFTDAETFLLPDGLTLPGLGLGLALSLLVPVNDLASQLLPGVISLPVSSDVSWHVLSLLDSGLGAIVGASFLYGVGAIYLRARGVEGMGFGDVKLMAMVGAFLGVKLTVFTIFAASVAGSIFGLWTLLAVWLKRTRRRMARNHESSSDARRHAWESARIALRRHQMPFGVFLGSMAIVALFFGNSLLHWYWRLL